ncbi:hypothetical protein Slin14017_G035870 [Septoria linicola]|nr:hypothetical protein Slin14017_G035870 [Septoria linicola]
MADPARAASGYWRKAQQLIKSLYLQEKYRPCIQICRDVLKATANNEDAHPLQDAYVNFYLGLCHNEIARIMHHNSVAKLPAYDDAEKHYLEALTALPTAKDARALCMRRYGECEDPFIQQQGSEDLPASPSITEDDYFDRRCSRASSLMLSSPPRYPDAEYIPHSPPVSSPTRTTSDFEDLESHQSFSELMTPHRVQRDWTSCNQCTPSQRLTTREVSRASLSEISPHTTALSREASRMSLIDAPVMQRQPAHISGLMRPFRMGSPATQVQDPPQMPYSSGFHRPKLPALAIRAQPDVRMSAPQLGNYNYGRRSSDLVSPVSPVSVNSGGSRRSSVSPVSPLGSDGLNERYSDTSTVSAVTPRTPPHMKHYSTPAMGFTAASAPPKEYLDEGMFARVTDHLTAMRAQLETHMNAVQQAKEQIHRAQALQQLSRPLSITSKNGFGGILSKSARASGGPTRQKSLQKSRSFWSFAPEDQKARKKKERIEAGRERKWKKDRFDPSKYRELCEQALAEL